MLCKLHNICWQTKSKSLQRSAIIEIESNRKPISQTKTIMAKRNELLPLVKDNWAGNRQVGGRYINIHRKPPAIKSINKWSISLTKERAAINYGSSWQPNLVRFMGVESMRENSLVWLGHNSFIINIDGVNMIFDPIFWDAPFVKRKSRLPINPDNIHNIDLALNSHDHFDHADKRSVQTLALNNTHMQIVAGLGMRELIESWSPFLKVNEMGWYQLFEFSGVKITFLPCQHYGKRSIGDSAKRLWGAFMIEGKNIKLYYSGDSSFAGHFDEIKPLFGKIDYALMGIGAYKPRWFLERNHLSPIEAIKASRIMGAKVVIPMHYGTFKLSREPIFDPPQAFRAEALRKNVEYRIPEIGEIVDL